jgi:hypothetical protein
MSEFQEVAAGSMKRVYVSVPVMGIVFGGVIYFSRTVQGAIDLLLVTVVAFMISDILSVLFIRGGGGILQIPVFGIKAQPKGYGFIAFFLSIPISALLVNLITGWISAVVVPMLADFVSDIIIGLGLAVLAYVDMNAKFYER